MEDDQKKFKEKCINRAANIVWHVGSAVPPMAFIKSVSDNKRHFNQLMNERESLIFQMYASRNYLWWMAHSDNEYKKFTEKGTTEQFLDEFGNNYIKDATTFINYLRELHNEKADSNKAKKDQENKPICRRANLSRAQDKIKRARDVSKYLASSSHTPTDDPRG